MKAIRVTVGVTSNSPEVIARASEALSRAAAGMALEGVPAFMMWSDDEDDSLTAKGDQDDQFPQ